MTKEEFDKLSPNYQKMYRRWQQTYEEVSSLLSKELAEARADGRQPLPLSVMLEQYAHQNIMYSSRQGLRFAVKQINPELLTNYRQQYAELTRK